MEREEGKQTYSTTSNTHVATSDPVDDATQVVSSHQEDAASDTSAHDAPTIVESTTVPVTEQPRELTEESESPTPSTSQTESSEEIISPSVVTSSTSSAAVPQPDTVRYSKSNNKKKKKNKYAEYTSAPVEQTKSQQTNAAGMQASTAAPLAASREETVQPVTAHADTKQPVATATESKQSMVVEAKPRTKTSTHVVAAETVQAEEVPTIPLGSLQTISTLQPEVSVHSVSSTRTVRQPVPLVEHTGETRRSFKEWVQVGWDGIRPSLLALPLLPALLGSALAWIPTVSKTAPLGSFKLPAFIGTVLVIFLLQIGANLLNDYYDFLRGVDTSNPLGPGGLIQQGLVQPARVFLLGFALMLVGAVAGLIVAISGGGLPVVLIGLVVVLCAYFYSATKYALSSLLLGELITFIVFGPLLTVGAYLMQRGPNPGSILIYSLLPGLLATAFIHANNMRDIEGDLQAGKRTLASVSGLQLSRILYVLLLVGAYAVVATLGIPSGAPHLILISLWTFPLFVVVLTGVIRTDAPAGLHLVMRQTLRLETYFILLLIVALLISTILPVLPQLPKILPI